MGRRDIDRWSLLSAHADDALPDDLRAEAEQLLRDDAQARADHARILALKRAVRARTALSASPQVWERVAGAIDREDRRIRSGPVVPDRYRHLVTAAALLVVLAIGAIAITQRDRLMSYLSDRSSDVQLAYEENLKGWLMPLLSRTDNDKVLQFAVFGALPLDDAAQSVVRIDSAEERGYRIAFGAAAETVPQQPVSVEALYSVVEATPVQRDRIDAVFAAAQRHLEAAVLVSDDNTIAIDQRLAGLDQVILSAVAAALEPSQRVRMARFLDERGSTVAMPFASASPRERVKERATIQEHMNAEPASFVVVSGGTHAAVRRVRINTDSIRRVIERVVVPDVVQAERRLAAAERMNVELQRMHREFEQAQRMHGSDSDISITREEDAIIIHIAPSAINRAMSPPPPPEAPGTGVPQPPRPPAPRMMLPALPRSTITVRVSSDASRAPGSSEAERLQLEFRQGTAPGIHLDVDSVVRQALRNMPALRRLGVPRTSDSLHLFLRRFGIADSLVRFQMEQSPRMREEIDRVLRDVHRELENELQPGIRRELKIEVEQEVRREMEQGRRPDGSRQSAERRLSDTTHSM